MATHNSTPTDDEDGLRGGTQGGGLGDLSVTNDRIANSSEPNPVTASGRQAQKSGGPPDVNAADPGTGNPTTIVSRPGFNDADPAVERKEGRSDGNMPQKSQHNPGDPENPLTKTGKS